MVVRCERPPHSSRQIGAFLIALGMAIGAVGLPRWPHVAWLLSISLNVLAAVAVLRLVGGYRRPPRAVRGRGRARRS